MNWIINTRGMSWKDFLAEGQDGGETSGEEEKGWDGGEAEQEEGCQEHGRDSKGSLQTSLVASA